jgi:hypothetical protein
VRLDVRSRTSTARASPITPPPAPPTPPIPMSRASTAQASSITRKCSFINCSLVASVHRPSKLYHAA